MCAFLYSYLSSGLLFDSLFGRTIKLIFQFLIKNGLDVETYYNYNVYCSRFHFF